MRRTLFVYLVQIEEMFENAFSLVIGLHLIAISYVELLKYTRQQRKEI